VRAAPLAVALALGLGACRAEAPEPPEAAAAGAPPAPAASTPAAATPAPAPSPSLAPDTPVANTIPARFHGVWDAEGGSCDRWSDARLEISAHEIAFYESRGSVLEVREGKDGAARVVLAMRGEGEEWEMGLTLTVTGAGAGERLVALIDPDGEVVLRPIRLKRCPV